MEGAETVSEPKTLELLYGQMRSEFAARTGFYMEDNDDLAVRLWAVAAQLAALYSECGWSYRQAFPQTAEGESLDLHGQMRGLRRREGLCARGTLRFFLDYPVMEAVPIPAGTVCTDAGLVRFVTLEEAVIPAGETYADAPARAEQPGAAGNAPAGAVTLMTRAPAAVAGVTNPEPLTGGADPEGDEPYRARILDSYRRLPNGANAAWYEARTLEVEGVAAVSVLPRWQGIGTVGVVVSGVQGMPEPALLAAVEAVLQPAREIATDVTVLSPEAVPVPVAVEVTVARGYDPATVLLNLRTALTQYFTGALLGRPLYRAALGKLIYGVEGVENYVLTAPAADVAIGPQQLPVADTLSVTETVTETEAV